jgi:signal transduction histidine kinase
MSIHLLLEERIGPLNDKQAELLIAARDDSQRLAATLEELLDLSRIESGGAQLALRAVTPVALVRDALEPFIVEAGDKGVLMDVDVPDDLPDVLADTEKVRHVFANLLSNALRFTQPGGGITVAARRGPRHVEFSVTDTGAGIALDSVGRIFEPFYRVPGQDDRSGVGLGLAIVKEIVQAHGGEVGVDSEPGRGSIFRFTLRCAS